MNDTKRTIACGLGLLMMGAVFASGPSFATNPEQNCQYPAATDDSLRGASHGYGPQGGAVVKVTDSTQTGTTLQRGVSSSSVNEDNVNECEEGVTTFSTDTFGGDAKCAPPNGSNSAGYLCDGNDDEVAGYDEEWDFGPGGAWLWRNHHTVEDGGAGDVCVTDDLNAVVNVDFTVTTQGDPESNVVKGPYLAPGVNDPTYDGDSSTPVLTVLAGGNTCPTLSWLYDNTNVLGNPQTNGTDDGPAVLDHYGDNGGWSGFSVRQSTLTLLPSDDVCPSGSTNWCDLHLFTGDTNTSAVQLGWRVFLVNRAAADSAPSTYASTPTKGTICTEAGSEAC